MPRTKKTTTKRQEILSAELNPIGHNDPIIEDMLSDKFVKGTNLEAVDMALAFTKLLNGQDELLRQSADNYLQIAKLRERMAAIDEMTNKFENDRKKWEEDMINRADKVRYPEAIRDKKNAEAVIDVQAAITKARAEVHTGRMEFDQAVNNMPKVSVLSPGKVEIIQDGATQRTVIMNEEVKIKHRTWVIPAGVPTEVPQCVADLMASRRRSEDETNARQKAMSSYMESGELNKAMKDIDKKFGAKTVGLGEQ